MTNETKAGVMSATLPVPGKTYPGKIARVFRKLGLAQLTSDDGTVEILVSLRAIPTKKTRGQLIEFVWGTAGVAQIRPRP